MKLLIAILLILLGILGAAPALTAKHPKLQNFIDSLRPYEGYIGTAGFIVAILYGFSLLQWISYFPSGMLMGILAILAFLELLGLGFLFGIGFMNEQFFKNNDNLRSKSEGLRAKLATFQVLMGFLAIMLGVVFLFESPRYY